VVSKFKATKYRFIFNAVNPADLICEIDEDEEGNCDIGEESGGCQKRWCLICIHINLHDYRRRYGLQAVHGQTQSIDVPPPVGFSFFL